MNLIKNEDLAWGCFEKAVFDEDIAACYDTSLKDFEHSGVHDLFKVCKLFYLVLSIIYTYVFCLTKFLLCVGNV